MIFNLFFLSRKTFKASARLQFGSSTLAVRKIDSASSNSDSIEGIPRCLLRSPSIPLDRNCGSKILYRQSILISRICKSHCWYLSRSIFTLDNSAIAIKLSGLFDASSEILISSHDTWSRWRMKRLTFVLYMERSCTTSTICFANEER